MMSHRFLPSSCLALLVGAVPGCTIEISGELPGDSDTDQSGSSGPTTPTEGGATEGGATEGGPTLGGTTEGGTTEGGSTGVASSSGPTGPTCGDGLVDPGEDCDDAGESARCDADCTEVECGDETLNAGAGEECDGAELGGATCASLGLPGEGLACDEGCVLDTTGCVVLPGEPALVLSPSAIKRFDFTWSAVADADDYQLEQSPAPGEPFAPVGGVIVGEAVSLTVPLHLRYEASYRLRACNGSGCTTSAPVDVMGTLAGAVGYVKASNPDAADGFGSALSLSGDGSTMVVGAPYEDAGATGVDGDQADDSAADSGAAYVLVRDATGQWSQQAYLKASNTGIGDGFGISVSLSDDGNTLAVGAFHERSGATGVGGDQDDDGAAEAGAAYVFVRDGLGQWSQQAYLKASNTDAEDAFAAGLALSGDGDTLVVGAPGEGSSATGVGGDQASNGAAEAGAAYVFVRDGLGQWSQQAYLKASNPDAGDAFGRRLSVSHDGSTLAVAAHREDSSGTGVGAFQNSNTQSQSGAVYVFVRDGMGQWSQQEYIKATNTGSLDAFGYALELSDDGDTLAVGAPGERSNALGIGGNQLDNGASSAGAAYVYVRDVWGAWSHQAYVKATNTDASDEFGQGLSLSGDGDMLAVGAHQEQGNSIGVGGSQASDLLDDSGAAYVYLRDGLGQWSPQAYLKASNPDAHDELGVGVALDDDGRTLAVGAPREDSSAAGIDGNQASNALSTLDSGAVYLY